MRFAPLGVLVWPLLLLGAVLARGESALQHRRRLLGRGGDRPAGPHARPLEADAVAHETRARLGDVSQREYRRIARALTKLLEAGIRVEEMRALLGNLALGAGDREAARAQADALLAADPTNAAGATLRGLLLLEDAEEEKPGDAAVARMDEWFARALRDDPDYTPALLGLVSVDLLREQTVRPETFDALQVVLTSHPDLPEAKELKVRLLAAAGRFDEAFALARLLLQWSSSYPQQRRIERLVEELEAAAPPPAAEQ